MSRVFVALEIPSHVVASAVSLQKKLDGLLYDTNISWLGSVNMHITLKFLNDITIAQIESLTNDLKNKVTMVSPFKIEALGLGCFPDVYRPRVIWVGVGGEVEMLCRLNSITDSSADKLQLNTGIRIFKPHFTIGRYRAKYNSNKSIEAEVLLDVIKNFGSCRLGEWQVDCIVVVKSELSKLGARHTPVSRISIK